MSQNHRSLERALQFSLGMAGLLALGVQIAPAENVVLHLRNGDHVAGSIISEDTHRVLLATSWIKELPVPLSAIARREAVTNLIAASVVAEQTPPAPAPNPAIVNAIAPKSPKLKRWKANVDVGTDLEFGAHDRQLYYGRLKLTCERPYTSDPKKFFRSIFDYAVDYGETDRLQSANRMDGSVKTDFDVGRRVFLYNLAGAGYDQVRKIDLHYEIGPGAGYHLFIWPRFVMNIEVGANYQVQERSSSPDVQDFYFRFAEDLAWKISPRVTLAEKCELFPRAENPGQWRARLDATLSFAVWQHISLNLSVLDLYDTDPALGANNNDLQIRSSLGITF